jgi:hypothetical protein
MQGVTLRFRALAGAGLCFFACGGEDERPPPGGSAITGGESGEPGETGGSSAGSSRGGKGSGGSSGSGAGDTSGAGGAEDGGEAGTTTNGGSGGSAFVLPNPSEDDQLIAVTPDELTIAWYSASGAAGSYYVADRTSASAAFGTPRSLSVENVIALSPNGLRLVAVSQPHDEFVELERATRTDAFGTPSPGAFSAINAALAASSELVGGGVIAPDDLTFYYTVLADQGIEYPLFVSTRSGSEPWPVGQAVESCEFRAQGALTRLPTAVSSDGLTLFYFDSVRGTSRAAWRATESGPFVWFRDLGEIARAQPNLACDRLYYSAFADDSGIFVAPAE